MVRRHRNRRTCSLSRVVSPSSPVPSESSDAVAGPITSLSDLDSHRTLFFDLPSSDSSALAGAVDSDRFDALDLMGESKSDGKEERVERKQSLREHESSHHVEGCHTGRGERLILSIGQ